MSEDPLSLSDLSSHCDLFRVSVGLKALWGLLLGH